MLQIQIIREDPDLVVNRLAIKNFDAKTIVGDILDLDRERRETQKMLDEHLAEANLASKQISVLMKEGRGDDAEELKARSNELKLMAKSLNEKMNAVSENLHNLMLLLPNMPHQLVAAGKGADDNEMVYSWGEIPVEGDHTIPHWELAAKYNLIGFDLGSKVTGAGFPFYINRGAKLQRALISFFLDQAVEAGYTEYQTPLMVNEESAFSTGQLPDKEGQMYTSTADNLFLIPTAEVPLTNIYRDIILTESELPVKICAYSPCFRREAGSYGKDVRGLNRLHQFDKVEIVQITNPDNSYNALEEMKDHVSGLLKKLKLPFRIMRLCGGDISFASAMTYDFEVWSAAQKRWLEVSSVSNFENFQSNRMKLRFKSNLGKTSLAHTLNGSALALPRIVAAMLENYQLKDDIELPEVLVPYTGFSRIIANL